MVKTIPAIPGSVIAPMEDNTPNTKKRFVKRAMLDTILQNYSRISYSNTKKSASAMISIQHQWF